jgi:hypothetical protein
MNATYMKFSAAALLFLLWTALVCTNHADPGLIDAIKFALGSLGLYHAATNLQGNDQLSMFVQALQARVTSVPAPAVPAPSAPTAEEIAVQIATALAQHPPVAVSTTVAPTSKVPA